jgi:hypothetical protein
MKPITQLATNHFHTFIRHADGGISATSTDSTEHVDLTPLMPHISEMIVDESGFIAHDGQNVYISQTFPKAIYRIPLQSITPQQLAVNLVRTSNTNDEGAFKSGRQTRQISFQILGTDGDIYHLEPEFTTHDADSDWHIVDQHDYTFIRLHSPHAIRQIITTHNDYLNDQAAYVIGQNAHVYQITSCTDSTLELHAVGQIPDAYTHAHIHSIQTQSPFIGLDSGLNPLFLCAHVDGTLHMDILGTNAYHFVLPTQIQTVTAFACISTLEALLLIAIHDQGTLSIEVVSIHAKVPAAYVIESIMSHQPLFMRHATLANVVQINAIQFTDMAIPCNPLGHIQLFGIVNDTHVCPLITMNPVMRVTIPDHMLYARPLPTAHGDLPIISVPVAATDDTLYWIDRNNVVNQITWIDNAPHVAPTQFINAVAISGAYDTLLVLDSDGRVSSTGDDVPAGLTHVVSITAGEFNAYAQCSDGSIVAWGNNDDYIVSHIQTHTDITSVVGGRHHVLFLTSQGRVGHLGSRAMNEADTYPLYTHGVRMIAGADFCAMAWLEDGRVVDLFERNISAITTCINVAQLACTCSLYAVRTQNNDTTIYYRYELLHGEQSNDWKTLTCTDVIHITATAHMLILVFTDGRIRAWFSDDQFGFAPVELPIPESVRCRV